jgi:hypothetical protein
MGSCPKYNLYLRQHDVIGYRAQTDDLYANLELGPDLDLGTVKQFYDDGW